MNEWYEKWDKNRIGSAIMGTYSHGGTVFTIGTINWAQGLKGNDPVVTRITKNILNHLLI